MLSTDFHQPPREPLLFDTIARAVVAASNLDPMRVAEPIRQLSQLSSLLEAGADVRAENNKRNSASSRLHDHMEIRNRQNYGQPVLDEDQEGTTTHHHPVIQSDISSATRLPRNRMVDAEYNDPLGVALRSAPLWMDILLPLYGLLKEWSSVNQADLLAAVQQRHERTFQMLLNQGIDLEAGGSHQGTALMSAILPGFAATAQLLLVPKPATIDTEEGPLGTTLYIASFTSMLNTVEHLLDLRADFQAKKTSFGMTHFMCATGDEHARLDQMPLLLNQADVEMVESPAPVLLRAAAFNRKPDITKSSLISESPSKEKRGTSELAPHMLAARDAHAIAVQMLVGHSANLEARVLKQWTALMFAAELGHVNTVDILIRCRADLEARDVNHRTALGLAARRGHTAVMRMLLMAGADANGPLETAGRHENQLLPLARNWWRT